MNTSSQIANRLEPVVVPDETPGIQPSFAFRFQLLRATDLSPVNAQRVAALDGKTVPCYQIVIGCEYAKNEFVVVRAGNLKWVGASAAPGSLPFRV